MSRKQLGYGFCMVTVLLAIVASGAIYRMLQQQGAARVRHDLDLHVEWRTRAIEERLRTALHPLAAMAVFMAANPFVDTRQFASIAQPASQLGIPSGRLQWSPLVSGQERDAFQQAVRAEGNKEYEIVELNQNGEFVPAATRDQYAPVRNELLRPGFPTGLGFDLLSTADRRSALEAARDQGQAIALWPKIRQKAFVTTPTFLLYWPVYEGGAAPKTIPQRQSRIRGYLSAVVLVTDALEFALADDLPHPETIIFEMSNLVGPDRNIQFVQYSPATGLVVLDKPHESPPAGSMVFRREFSAMQQRTALQFVFPPDAAGPHARAPAVAAGSVLLVGLLMAATAFEFVRRSAMDRTRQRLLADVNRQLRTANDAIVAANAELVRREQVASDLARARTRFLAAASHDMQQPLHALVMFRAALQHRITDKVGLEILADIGDLAFSMRTMFNSVLDLSRLDAGAMVVDKRTTPTSRMIDKLLAEFVAAANEKGLVLKRAGRFPIVETDPALLALVLRKLVDNAIKFTNQGGVLVGGRIKGDTVCFSVWDTGPGIPPDQLGPIFDEFRRLATPEAKPGFGLGLAIAHQVTNLLGGRLTVRSRVGHGSCFTLTLKRQSVRTVAAAEMTDDAWASQGKSPGS